jgi:hypothetical protein
MSASQDFFKKNIFSCLGVMIFAVCMVIVFSEAFPKFVALASPDSGPFFSFAPRTGAFEGLLTGSPFTPQKLYWLLLNPLYAHDLTYILDTFFLTLAGVYYLTGQRVHPLAAWTGGLALGLCGYTFTLFCAGHRGYFHMFSCVMWAFGLLSRCFETRRLFYFAMLGLVFAWGVPYQPDVVVLAGAVVAAYALWLTGHSKVKTGDWKREVGRRIVSVWPRFGVSILVLGLAGFDGVRSAVTTQVASREAQISGVTAQAAQTGAKPTKRSAKEEHDRWIFATNWSLPPEDMLEFVVPGVFGNDSMQMPYPYWGRLGRPADEVFQKGRMMPNYRQHTVYLGMISVLFALFGVIAYFSNRKKHASRLSPVSAGDKPTADRRLPIADHSDVPFWCGVWAVCLLLAMGRYTPFYRLFYSIPYMGYIRDPVKFHHLVEAATAFLAGFGMNAFLRSEDGTLRRKLVWLGACFAGSLLVGALVFWVAQPLIQRHAAELGLGQAASVLGGYSAQNMMRSACLAALVSGVVWVASKWEKRSAVWLGCGLMIVLATEQACVALRYVRVINVEPFYSENAVVKAIHKASCGQMVNAINYVTPNAGPQDWFSTALSMNGIRNLAPGTDDRETPRGKLFAALQNDPLRLWQICGVQYVMLPAKASEVLLRSGRVTHVLDFELGAGSVRQVALPSDKAFSLFRVQQAAGPRWVADWKGGVAPARQIETLGVEKRDVSDAPLPDDLRSGIEKAGNVRVLAERGLPGVFATRVGVSSKKAGLLVFGEPLTDRQEILVDGQRVTLYVADALWPAAVVPTGEHEVVLRERRAYIPPFLSGLAALIVLIWFGVDVMVAKRAKSSGVAA